MLLLICVTFLCSTAVCLWNCFGWELSWLILRTERPLGGAVYIVATLCWSGLEEAVQDDMTARVRESVGYVASKITHAASSVQEQLVALTVLAIQGPLVDKDTSTKDSHISITKELFP